MNLGLEGKIALVTGAGRDIGREIALTLAREGAAVAVNYLKSKSAAEGTAEEIRAAGGRALAVGADIADYAAVQAMVERVSSSCRRRPRSGERKSTSGSTACSTAATPSRPGWSSARAAASSTSSATRHAWDRGSSPSLSPRAVGY